MLLHRDTPFEVGFLTWQLEPPDTALVVVVKATFELTEARCRVAAVQRPCTGDVHQEDDPTRSLRAGSDLVVFKPRGEVTLHGTCHVDGPPAGQSAVAFKVGPVSRALAVHGDRVWRAGAPSDPVPFTAMPLHAERAWGGPEVPANPVGVGARPGLDGVRRLPNLELLDQPVVDPDDAHAPALVGAVPCTWAPRVGRAGTYDERYIATRWPWFAADLDWRWCNGAPDAQQREGYWRGDEEVVLRGLLAATPELRTALPGLRARVLALREVDGDLRAREVPLRLDTVHLDTDDGVVTCVWRGATKVEAHDAADLAELFAFHEPLDAPHTLAAALARRDAFLASLAAEDEAYEPESDDDAAADDDDDDDDGPDDAAEGEGDSTASEGAAAPEVFASVQASVEARLKELGIAAAPAAPGDAASLRARLALAGVEPPPEVMALLEADADDDEEDRDTVVPEAPEASESLRAFVVRCLARGLSLEGCELDRADLSGLDLRGADFTGASLLGASLRGAQLDDACFEGAQLGGADLREVSGPGACFDGADLSGASLSGASLARASFVDAVADDAGFEDVTLLDATCEGLSAPRARFDRALARGVRLDRGDLDGASLTDADLRGASLAELSLQGAQARGIRLDGADLRELHGGGGAVLKGASITRTRGAGAVFRGCILDEADLSFSDLPGADFSEASLVAARLHGCDLRGASFDGARAVGGSWVSSQLMEASFEGADLSHGDFKGACCFAAGFWRAQTAGARWEETNLDRTLLSP
jgi:uncharacterized protein YjbI with pentapeptide repeats